MVVAGVKTGVAREFFTRDQLSNDVEAMAAEFQAQSKMEKQTRVARENPSLSPVPVCTPNTFRVFVHKSLPTECPVGTEDTSNDFLFYTARGLN